VIVKELHEKKTLSEKIDPIFRHATAAVEVPGVVAIAATEREIIYEGAFGTRELGKTDAMTPNTVGYIASMTKPITAAAAMQLVENGKLKLDEPAGDVIPNLNEVQVLDGFDTAGRPILRSPKRAVTLRHLLTHTSGFGYEIWNNDITRYLQATGTPSIFTSEDAALTAPLLCDPGERWVYGISIDWVGKLVEAVSGQKLGQYMQENLFAPLGMDSTSFKLTPSQRTRLASMHARAPGGSLSVSPFEFIQEPEFEQGGGGLYSTMQDYLRFTQMLLHGGTLDGQQVLEPESVRMMSQNHIGDIDVVELRTAMPNLSNNADFFPGMKQKWGLSFLINTEQTQEGRSAGSIAWAGLCNCYFWIDPKKRVTGAIMTQIFPFFDARVINIFRSFESAVYQSL
jgi:methyl acetate hydrolase